MVDDTNGVQQSNTETNLTESSSSQLGWVTFEEQDQESKCVNCVDKEQVCTQNGQYISRLEKELQRLQDKKRKPLSSKDMLRTLQEAKDSHMKHLMDRPEQSEAFLMDEGVRNDTSCCFPLCRVVFPKQPLNSEELECLVEGGGDEDNNGTVKEDLRT